MGKKQFEIVASSRSSVEKSPQKKFSLPIDLKALDPDYESAPEIQLRELDDVSVSQHVTISAKVVGVEAQSSKSGKSLLKQDCSVADATGTSRIVLWEGDVAKLKMGTCYKVERATVRMFQYAKYLSLSESAVVVPIDDIGEVSDLPSDEESPNGCRVLEGEIVGVASDEEYTSCINCMAKVKILSEVMAECKKCGMKVNLSSCSVSSNACVLFKPVGGVKLKVTLFQKELEAITAHASDDSLEEKLFTVGRVKLCINSRDIVSSASIL